MNAFQRAMSNLSGGRWMIEYFVVSQIGALPDGVLQLPVVRALLSAYEYDIRGTGLDLRMLAFWGCACRALTLLRLLWVACGWQLVSLPSAVRRAARRRAAPAPPAYDGTMPAAGGGAAPRRGGARRAAHPASATPPTVLQMRQMSQD